MDYKKTREINLKLALLKISSKFTLLSLTHYRPAKPFGNRKKNILEDLFSLILLKFRKHNPSEILKFNNFGIFQSLKFRVLIKTILPISLRLYFTLNALGCYGLNFIHSKLRHCQLLV